MSDSIRSSVLMSGSLKVDHDRGNVGEEKLKSAIDRLLNLCAENKVEVPEDIKSALVLERSRRNGSGGDGTVNVVSSITKSSVQSLINSLKHNRSIPEEDDLIRRVAEIEANLESKLPHLDLRVKDGSYTVTNSVYEEEEEENENGIPSQDGDDEEQHQTKEQPRRAKQKIETCWNTSLPYRLCSFLIRCFSGQGGKKEETRAIVDGVNLVFEPGKMYLVLGAPGSGKSTLLKMISNSLPQSKTMSLGGEVSISGARPKDVNAWTSLVAYIDQIDRLHPFLTVYETWDFAWKCRSGGTHREVYHGEGPTVDATIAKLDAEKTLINLNLEALGLARVKDTFVGDQTRVRGVSGGERKRVTVGEMSCVDTPIICCDEISTGLDAATTFDIMRLSGTANRMAKAITIVSLLQPPPETVATFDELILLSEGKIIYAGPLEHVVHHFQSLGYEIPPRMDVADWLQTLSTKEGQMFLKETAKYHLTPDEFRDRFYASEQGKAILEQLDSPVKNDDIDMIKQMSAKRYQNPWYKSLQLLIQRELLLFWRDKYFMISKFCETLLMGIVNGTVFWQVGGKVPQAVLSVVVNAMFYPVVGAMVMGAKQFLERPIFYKQQDSNFFPTWAIMVARIISGLPVALMDAVVFGTLLFWFTGLAYNDGASIANYFVFMLLLLVTSLSTFLFFTVFSAVVRDLPLLQSAQAVVGIVFILFSGFTVQPDVIPVWYGWIYWINLFAWQLRAFIVNEFQSGKYDDVVTINGMNITSGDYYMKTFGVTLPSGEPFGYEWVWWGVLFSVAYGAISIGLATLFFNTIRYNTGQSLVTDPGEEGEGEETCASLSRAGIPFQSVNLTFRDIRYTVKASTSDEKLELLRGIDGFVLAGKMTALMGSSGAGKTTLMDVLAMRKSSGEISGEICLNGHPQEEESFRRCTGYVEQFDVQTPQLTIRETVKFSAKLRLDEKEPAVTKESTELFVDTVLEMLELTNIENLQVGSDSAGGLSFEQRKRLSIAVELVANPSVIFLDEPTSGLDARAASIVMRGLKRIALSGRAVCATIHQPSIAIFSEFDSLLLLKRGGEVVFFGELGNNSDYLIKYLESYDATPKIQPGENPSTWMLTAIGGGVTATNFDYAGSYKSSKLRSMNLERIDEICEGATESNLVTYQSDYATSVWSQSKRVICRSMKVYFRSPSYNYSRIVVSVFVALLFGTCYIQRRVPTNESDMFSRINSVFMAMLFLGLNAFNAVLDVFEMERNMFYRHKAAKMYSSYAIIGAATVAELPFILLATIFFVVPFYFIMGFANSAGSFFLFFLFNFFNLAVFTYAGQMFMSLLRTLQVAQGLGGLFLTFNSLFAGVFLRPQDIPPFWIFMYWLVPAHYIFEGTYMALFTGDETPIEATPHSDFWYAMNCTDIPCTKGTAEQWVQTSFTEFSADHVYYCIIYLAAFLIVSRLATYLALVFINYRST